MCVVFVIDLLLSSYPLCANLRNISIVYTILCCCSFTERFSNSVYISTSCSKSAKRLLFVDGSTYIDGYYDFQFEVGNRSLKRLWN